MPASESKKAIARSMTLLAVLAIVGGLAWFSALRVREIQSGLADSEERMETLTDNLSRYSDELDQALERARAERERATAAEDLAARQQSARAAAEAELSRAETDAAEARAESQRQRDEIAEIRRRRQQELDRMQEALNRVAPARRTPAGIVMTLSNEAFRFDFDDASLRPENRETLSRIAGILLASEGYRLFIDGHTDDVGTVEYNQDLSERRANSVRDYLVDAGIPPELIDIHGFGKSHPLIDETTADARARNRRVEIGIVDTIIDYDQPVRN